VQQDITTKHGQEHPNAEEGCCLGNSHGRRVVAEKITQAQTQQGQNYEARQAGWPGSLEEKEHDEVVSGEW
jgi:hypothetical protein